MAAGRFQHGKVVSGEVVGVGRAEEMAADLVTAALQEAAAVFEEIRKAVPAYNVPIAGLLTGGAEATRVQVTRNSHAPYDVPVGLIRSANDTLFTSGTLGRFCTMMESLPEAET